VDHSEFRSQVDRFATSRLTGEAFNSDAWEAWSDHKWSCRECAEFVMAFEVEQAGKRVQDYPCVHMAYKLLHDCDVHPDPFDCPDTVIVHGDSGFGLPIHDGWRSYHVIDFCPWCGVSLGERLEGFGHIAVEPENQPDDQA
jgi:hypothetical protein